MDVNFDRIINDLNGIVADFESLLDAGNYDEAKKAIEDIAYELNSNNDIELDKASAGYDNSFHELYDLLTQTVASKTTPAAPVAGSTMNYDGLKQLLEQTADKIFKTAEVRKELISKDPDQNAYKQALEEGLIESEEEKNELEEIKKKYDFIELEVFFDQTVSPAMDRRSIIEEHRLNFTQLQEIIDSIEEINKLSGWINNPTYAGSMYDTQRQAWKSQIDTIKIGIGNKVNELGNRGLDVTTLADITDDANISGGNSKATTQVLQDQEKNKLEAQYEKIREQLENAQNGDIEYTDSNGDIINIKDEEVIHNLPDMKSIDVTTDDGKAKIEKAISDINDKVTQIKDQIDVKDQEIEIFNDHIQIIEKEKEILNKDPDDREAYVNNFDSVTKQKIEDEKQRRHEDCRAKTLGDPEKAKEYKEAWKRFQAHRVTTTASITDPSGNTINYEYETITDYPEKQNDLEFMQVESWEEKSKTMGIVNALGGKENIDAIAFAYNEYGKRRIKLNNELNAMTSAVTGTYTQDQINAKKQEISNLESEMMQRCSRDNDYINNYNNSHFAAKDSVAILATGGSAMMVKKPGFLGGLQAFTKVTIPHSAREIIPCAISSVCGVASIPLRTVELVIGLGASGVQSLASRIAGTYNMPTPYRVGWTARKEAREEYYLNNGSTAFVAWFKSWFPGSVIDSNGNKISLNEHLIAEKCKVIDESIEDKYIRYARAELLMEKEKALRNNRARKAAYKNMAKGEEVYEDIYDYAEELAAKDPNDPAVEQAAEISREKTGKKIMQRAILTFGGKSKDSITDQSKTSFARSGDLSKDETMKSHKRSGKFKQSNAATLVSFDKDISSDYDFNGTIGDTVWTNAVSKENILRAMTKNRDRALKVVAGVAMGAAHYFLTRPVAIYQDPQTVTDMDIQDGSEPIVKIQKPRYRTETFNTTENVSVDVSYENATVGDCVRGDTSYWTARLDADTLHNSSTFTDAHTDVQGINFTFKDVNGEKISYSIGDTRIKNYINSHPGCTEFSTTYTDLNIDSNTPISELVDLLPEDVKQKYLEALNASSDKLAFSNDTMQLAYGKATSNTEIMPRGWSDANIPKSATKIVEQTVQKTKQVLDGYDWEEVTAEGPKQAIITSSERTIPGQYITKNSKLYEFEQNHQWVKLLGPASMIAQVVQQGLDPVFRKGNKSTRNKHKVESGKQRITEESIYDMYEDR